MLKRVIIFLIIIVFLGLLSIYMSPSKNKQYEKESCFVNRVIDGDTLVCDNETIRLLGINNIEV